MTSKIKFLGQQAVVKESGFGEDEPFVLFK